MDNQELAELIHERVSSWSEELNVTLTVGFLLPDDVGGSVVAAWAETSEEAGVQVAKSVSHLLMNFYLNDREAFRATLGAVFDHLREKGERFEELAHPFTSYSFLN